MVKIDYLVTRSFERARRHALALSGRRALHFLHIGKTGGSAIRHALADARKTPSYRVYLHRHGTTLREVPRGDLFMFCLRDPVTRFTSGFYSRQRCGQPKTYVPWSPAEEAAFKNFETPNELALALNDPDEPRRRQARHAMASIQHVRDPYRHWLRSLEYLQWRADDLFFIGFQESLDDDFEKLRARLGLGNDVRLPRDEVASHRTPAHLDKRLDADARPGPVAVSYERRVGDRKSCPARCESRLKACHDQDLQRRRARFSAQPFGTSAVVRQSRVLARLRRMTARRVLRLVLPHNSAWLGLV